MTTRVDVQRYPVTAQEGRRAAAPVMARAALRFGTMRAAAVALVLLVLVVALLRREPAFLVSAALVPFICTGVCWTYSRFSTAGGGDWWVARSDAGVAVLRAVPRDHGRTWRITDFAAIPRGLGLGRDLAETFARQLPPGTLLEGTVVAGPLVKAYRAWGYEVTPRPGSLGLLYQVRRTL